MGKPMAARLLGAGYRVTVWNRTPEKLGAPELSGATHASSPAAVARNSDVVCLCLIDAAAVEEVVFGTDGVASGTTRGQILLDFSSISPSATLRMSDRLRNDAEAQWIDAPVSGGVPGAEEGRLVILCGGPEATLAQLEGLLATLSRRATRMGDVGAGQMAKLCNQMIVAANILAITEAMAMGTEYGIDIESLPEALAGGWADSTPLQLIGPRIASGDDKPRLGALSIMLKDIEAVVSLAEKSGVSVPLSEQIAERYREACAAGLADEDISAIRSLYPIPTANRR